MLRGLYSATSAMVNGLTNQTIAADNLAHATQTGYRRRGVTFESFETILERRVGETGGGQFLGAQPNGSFNSFDPGPVEYTGNPLDLAPVGNNFFTVESPNGPLFTRAGNFMLNATGEIITRSGLPVRGEGGRITVPPDTITINITEDGIVQADGRAVGQLQMQRFPNGTLLTQVGDTLFQGPVPQGTPEPGESRLRQGYLERSNVQVVHEMVTMLSGVRHYEAAQRALRSLSEALAQNTRPAA